MSKATILVTGATGLHGGVGGYTARFLREAGATVRALVRTRDHRSEALDKLIADVRPRLKTVTTEKTSPNLEVESALNADGVARDLVKRSDIIRKKVETGELVIKAALYRMDSGKVSFY